MAIPTTQDEARKQHVRDLARKMQLEKPMARDFRRLFREIGFDLAGNYIRFQRVMDLDEYRDDIVATLRLNYRKIADQFAYGLIEETDEIKQLEDLPAIGDTPITDDGTSRQTTTQEREMIINSLLAQQIRAISVARADQILATTQKNLQRDVDNVVAEAAATGVFLTAAQIAEQSRMRFNQNGINRSQLIAMTEVEMMAENSKNTEQEVLMATGATIGGVLLINALEKIWMAVLDSVTRATHAVADGQRVPLNESFMVGGEQLRYPGDPRGRPENIINCRCSSQTIKK